MNPNHVIIALFVLAVAVMSYIIHTLSERNAALQQAADASRRLERQCAEMERQLDAMTKAADKAADELGENASTMEKAADKVESLMAEVDTLRKQRDDARETIGQVIKERDRWSRAFQEEGNSHANAQHMLFVTIEQLVKELRRARPAFKPEEIPAIQNAERAMALHRKIVEENG